MIVLGVYLLLYYARLNNEKQIINEMEEEVIATLLYFDFCCTIGIALFIPLFFNSLIFTNTSFWRFALHCQKKSQGTCRPPATGNYILIILKLLL